MSISLRRLRIFVAVADHKSVTEAARALVLTPSAATKGVRELEQELGVSLLRRTADGMRLTRFGEAFYLRSKMALAEIEYGREEIAHLRGGRGGNIVIGVLPDGHPIVPSALARFLQTHRALNVSIRGGLFEQHVEATRSADMDFFFGVALGREDIKGLVKETLCHDELVVVCRPGHPLSMRKRLTLSDLVNQRWILPTTQSPLWTVLTDVLRTADLAPPTEWVEVHAFSAMRTILSESNMISPTTRMRVDDELRLGLMTALPVNLSDARLTVSVFRRETGLLSQSARSLLTAIRRMAKDYVARRR